MRLLLDVMCGGLRSYLRMCGHDAVYALDRDREAPAAVLSLANDEDRTLVTRNVRLAERADEAILLRERDVTDQLGELRAAGVDLRLADPPSRCSTCNGTLERVAPGERTAEYAPDPREEAVWRCRDCGQQFWRGSHWDDVRATLAAVRAS